ncbi:MAG: hypothetical protein Q9183_006142, partial [Haloplaca sp. 2 TL-2023]
PPTRSKLPIRFTSSNPFHSPLRHPSIHSPHQTHQIEDMAPPGTTSTSLETTTPNKPFLLESDNVASSPGDSTLVETPTKPSPLKINNTASFEEDPLLEIDASVFQEDAPEQPASSIFKTKEIPQQLDHVDPDGDVDIILGKPGMLSSVRVSSKILSVVSPVFKRMFSPYFAEGQNLSASSPEKVHLPADYPEAMIWLLRALHLDPEMNLEPHPDIREKVVYLCDKYHCIARMRSYFKSWIENWRDSCISKRKKDPLNMLCLSYTLKDPVLFWWSTANIIKYYQDDDFPIDGADYLPLSILPERLLPSLKARRDDVVDFLGQHLDNTVSTFIGPNDNNNGWGRKCPLDASPSDCSREAQVDYYFCELERLYLSPRSTLRYLSLHNLVCQCEQYRPYKKYLEETEAQEPPECSCFFDQLHPRAGMFALDSELELGGICLECFVAGRIDGNGVLEWTKLKKVGNCRCKYEPGVCCYRAEDWEQEGDEGGDGDDPSAWNDKVAGGMAGSW